MYCKNHLILSTGKLAQLVRAFNCGAEVSGSSPRYSNIFSVRKGNIGYFLHFLTKCYGAQTNKQTKMTNNDNTGHQPILVNYSGCLELSKT